MNRHQRFIRATKAVSFALVACGIGFAQPSGATADLMTYVSDNYKVEYIQSAIDAGADVEYTFESGITALHILAQHAACNPEGMLALIAAGAEVDAQSTDGLTPIGIAANRGCPSVLKTLIDNGANVNVVGWEGKTPLIEAAGSEIKVRLLIEAGADLNAQDDQGWTTAMRSIPFYGSDIESFKLLVEAGADLSIKDNEGNTLLDQIRETPEKERFFKEVSEITAIQR